MKLQNLQIGQSYIVQDCQLTDEIRKHLAHLGLNLGVEIRIISKTKANAIFQIRS
ncbi:TPA: ferrous iron transport protein A, partial [Streptococcus suis]